MFNNRTPELFDGKKANIDEYRESFFVVDPSIIEVKIMDKIVYDLLLNQQEIILTSGTIKTLYENQFYDDTLGYNSRLLFNLAILYPNVTIDKIGSYDNTISYCYANPNSVLLTADKFMHNRALTLGIRSKYLEDERFSNSGLISLYGTKLESGKIFYNVLTTNTKLCILRANGKSYTNGLHQLHVGDNIYSIAERKKFISFLHTVVRYERFVKNAEIIYLHRIYSEADILDVPQEYFDMLYKFIRNSF